jgi:hypothetical protein
MGLSYDPWEAWNRQQLICECEPDECCDVCRHDAEKIAMIADFERDRKLTDE